MKTYNLKKALIDNKYIDEKPNSKITSELFINILRNSWSYSYPKTEVLFKSESEDIKKSIYSIDTKLIKKSFIFYDKNEYYIGETISENGKLIKKGYGAYFFNNGDRYEGFWNNDLKNGEGCMFYRTSGLIGVKKEILYHLNDNIVLKLITFLSSGDIILTSREWKNNSGEWKNIQVYFNFNKSNPGYLGYYEGDIVNNLPNGDSKKMNYQNGKLVSEVRGVFVNGKISVEDKKKIENSNYTVVSNNSYNKGESTTVSTPNKSIKYGGILLGELNGNVWISSTEDSPYELTMEGVSSARNYCWNLVQNGYSDWILPTSETIKLPNFKKLLLTKKDSYYWLDIKEDNFRTYTFYTKSQILFYIWNNKTACVKCVRYFKK